MLLPGLALGLPFVALAATGCGTSGTLAYIICTVGNLLSAIIPVLVVLGIIYFVWGVITYVISDDEEAKKAGRDRIIFGIIGLVAIVAMWGLVNVLVSTFGLGDNETVPTLPGI